MFQSKQNSGKFQFFFLSLTYFKEILSLLFLACSNVKIITLRETSCHDMKHQGNSLFATRTTHGKKLSRRENLFSKHVTLIQDEANSNVCSLGRVLKYVHKKRT